MVLGSVHLENVVYSEQTAGDCCLEEVLACTKFFYSFSDNLLL